MGYMLETRGLTKRFGRGDQAQDAVADVSLHIREGEVYGLLGPNGAGKSTTLKMICGMLRPTAGEILFAGHAWRREDLYAIGSLIEEAPFYPNLTARENLREYLPQWVSRDLAGLLPNPQNLMLVGAAAGSALALALVARRASRVISRKMAPLAEAAGRVGAGELDFAVGSTNVREVNDVLAAMDAMRASLAESLEARWAAERGQREQVASLAHDLKTPLTVLRANADFVAEELEDEKDADLAAAARDIAGSVERLDGYVRLLIEASRGSGGAERAPMRPAELCEQVLAEAAQIARARGVTLDAATGPAVAGAPEAPLDRTTLARAAANLVANAAEHARSRVAVSCDVAGGYLVIEVADDGPGFSPAALERGCERLFTDDSSRSSRDGGRHYGLGLHVASEAASAHGGSVSLANSPSGGAVATIAVPLCGA